MLGFGKLGSDEGKVTGPAPGDGSSSLGGSHDVEGTAPDELPPRPGEGKDPGGRRPAADEPEAHQG